ncbi:hypothetical protein AB6E71_13270 [Staphylococcus arlettae]|uniref:hypothetical protein n=1 Tax=Staphylococcus arlettae TaxID=29378 RepID=UPI0034DD5A33
MNQQKIDEITQLSQGNEKDKKLALTYGYQPVIEKLKKDKNQEVVEFAQAIDANEDLKLFKNSLYFQQSKDRFQRYLTQATQYMYITLALIFIAMLSILIAVIIFFVNPETSVTTFIVITIIALIASVVLVMLSKKLNIITTIANKFWHRLSIYSIFLKPTHNHYKLKLKTKRIRYTCELTIQFWQSSVRQPSA